MSDVVKLTLKQAASPTLPDSDRRELFSVELPGSSLLNEELYATTAARLAVDHGFYYVIDHRRTHSEVGAGFESHEIVITVIAGAAGGATSALVQQLASSVGKLASIFGNRHELSEAEAIQRAIECAEMLDDPPSLAELEVRSTGERVVTLSTASNRIRVELDKYGAVLKIDRRSKQSKQAVPTMDEGG